MERREIEFRGAGGHRLLAEDTGPEDGPLLVFHGGTPGGRTLPEWWLREAHERGLRHVCYSRPGYSGSERVPGRTVADCAADAVALADRLGFDSFLNVGNSGGGPHALACAALAPERVHATLVLAGVAPTTAEGLDWSEGMCRENLDELRELRAGDAALQRFIEGEAEKLLADADTTESWSDALCEADHAVVAGRLGSSQSAAVEQALGAGIWGWFDDQKALWDADWSFPLDRVAGPLLLAQGDQDRMVPAGHTLWLAARLPGSDLMLFPGEGHISLLEHHYGTILDALLAA